MSLQNQSVDPNFKLIATIGNNDILMDIYSYIKEMSLNHLTLGYYRKMSPGDVLDVVIWDRNFEEYGIWPDSTKIPYEFKENTPYKATDLFGNNRAKILITNESIIATSPCEEKVWCEREFSPRKTWRITYYDGESEDLSLELNLGDWPEMFNIEGDCWYPINDQGDIILNDKKVNIADFPENVRIGYRGPIMLWKNIQSAPPLYWKNP